MGQMVHVELARMGFGGEQHAMLLLNACNTEHAGDLTAAQVDEFLAHAEAIAERMGQQVGRKWRDRNGAGHRNRMLWAIGQAADRHSAGWVSEIIRRATGTPTLPDALSDQELHDVVGAIKRTENWRPRKAASNAVQRPCEPPLREGEIPF